MGNTVKILSHKTCCLLENDSGESVGSAAGPGDSRSVPSLLTLTGLSRFLGEPGEGQLLFPEEPDPLHHPSRTRKYLPHHICFLHQIWKESVGKKLLSDWDREGGLHEKAHGRCWRFLFLKSGFHQLTQKDSRTVIKSHFSVQGFSQDVKWKPLQPTKQDTNDFSS